MPHVFISYAWLDGTDLARKLYQSFNDLDGWSAWMDTRLHADSVFGYELQQRILQADMVVVVLSPDVNRAGTASFVQKELHFATQSGVAKPVFAARAADTFIPLIIAGVTYQDFFDDRHYDDAFSGLIQKIERSPRSAPHSDRLTKRERELAYLRNVARDHGFWGKVYVDTAAEARVRPEPLPADEADSDPDVVAYLSELAMAIHPEKRHSADDDAARETVENFDALTDALAQFERVAIIGDPGSGKTTTLRRFAFELAEEASRNEGAPLPVFVPLGGYTGGNLGAYIAQQFGYSEKHGDAERFIPLPLAEYLSGRIVVLLDGLNETAYENIPAVQSWLAAHPNVRVMLSCRKLDYIERELDLQRVDVLPLDMRRIRVFMAAYSLSEQQRDTLFWGLAGEELAAIWNVWQRENRAFDAFWTSDEITYSLTAAQRQVLKQVRSEFQQQDRYPGLLGLVRNPFLLTLTIAIFRDQQAVPRNRGQLFNDFVRMLFTERGKRAAEQAQVTWYPVDVQREALARLAYRMQREKQQTRVPYAWARGVVAEAAPEHDPDHVLYLAAGAGIIEKGAEVRFTHQLLQEYFAAYGLGEDIERGEPASAFWPGGRWWEVTGWEETVLLLAGMHPDDADWASRVAKWTMAAHPVLACRVVIECGMPVDDTTRQQVRQAWPAALVPDAAPGARAESGRLINTLGDPRPGIVAPDGVPEFAWCEVPAGRFKMGGDPGALNAWEGAEFELPYAFWIAKYPVTYAQYEPFVAAGGYQERHYWTEAGWQDKGDRTEPGYWNSPEWHIANHPVVGVTWYEAYAYTQWLNEQGIKPVGAPDDFVIRLPRECEWEKAARYPDGRLWPWGNTQGNRFKIKPG